MLTIRNIYNDGYTNEFVNDFIYKKSPRYVFGTNELAQKIAEAMDVDGFINTYGTISTFLGKKCISSLDDVPEDALVINCVISWKVKEINKTLSYYQFRYLDATSFITKANLDIDLFHFTGWKDDINSHFKEYENVYDLLADKKSKNTFFNLINYKISGDLRYLACFDDLRPDQYFEDFLNLPPNPTFADIGGFQGETSIKFIERYPDYNAIYFFEPEISNLNLAKKVLSPYANIQFFPIGLFNRKGTLSFISDGSSSKISNSSSESSIHVDCLDNIVNTKIDFIKMDIEGAEGDAIDGMKNTIQNYHPALAVCVYHKPDDFRILTRKILNIRNDYTLYMRHYSAGVDETVMFFIPQK